MSKHARSPSQEDGLKHPSTKRAKEIDAHTPLNVLEDLLQTQKHTHKPRNVLHWFRSKDLRAEDNTALAAASKKVKEGSGHLIALYLFAPKDMQWHGTSPARSDFIIESLRILRDQLAKQNIPLACVTAEQRTDKVKNIIDFVKEHNVSHIYANYEYEVDELRRDISLVKRMDDEKELSFSVHHDQVVIKPGDIKTGSGGPAKVFTPYHKSWLSEVSSNPDLIKLHPVPAANKPAACEVLKLLFHQQVPTLPDSKQFGDEEERDRIRKLWPPGHQAAVERLQQFLKHKVENYADDRSNASKDPSSRLSAYFSAGVLSVREALSAAAAANKTGTDFSTNGDPGIAAWVREIVFREFYRQSLVVVPHNAMNLPLNLKFDNVEWETDDEGWKKWCEGKTGVPFVDAGMRQLNTQAYMHNRLRMNTSSYLRTNLLIDYRRGERYFAEHLIDWDLGNNTQGWEPSYTVFNPVSQSEKHDPEGEFIRQWVPELRNVEGKAVFAPWERLDRKEFEELGYPRPHVDFSESKDRCLQRYKQGLAEADP